MSLNMNPVRELKYTDAMMNSADYKERFKAEYAHIGAGEPEPMAAM